jgi:hypothetical protein
VIRVKDDSKFLFTGPAENIVVRDNDHAYVDGTFYQVGGGNRIYPVGIGLTYAPLNFEDMHTEATDTIGIEIKTGAPKFDNNDFADGSVAEVAKDHFWEIVPGITTPISKIKSVVRLGVNSINLTEGSKIVLQSEVDGSDAKNLGFQFDSEGFVKSLREVTAPILAVGRVDEVIVTIYELITPFGSPGHNDYLQIQNIGSFTHKRVLLLDRYGVLIKEWGDNFDTDVQAWDFKKLSPGNYICVAEYGNSNDDMKKQTQMITVLRSN